MAYTAVPVDNFAGLNLLNDPLDIGFSGATDLADCDLDERGRIGSRPGFRQIHTTTTAATYPPMVWYRSSSGVDYIVADGIPIKTDGSGVGTGGPVNGVSNNSWARYGGVLCGVDGGANEINTFDGTSWATVPLPASFNPTLVAAAPFDGRLALADDDVVYFSDPDSTTVDSLNFVSFAGDGEKNRAVVAWRDLLFVFRQTRFFVFYGSSVDSAGGPIFNYRTVDTKHGVYGHGAAVAGDEGVYFTSRDQAFVTGGDAPVVISTLLGRIAPFTIDGLHGGAHVFYRGRFFRSMPGATWVFDPDGQQWLKWTPDIANMCLGPDSTDLYVVSSTTQRLGVFDPEAATDGGTTNTNGDSVQWTYTSGWSDLGTPDRKVIREVSGWGKGLVSLQVRPNISGDFVSSSLMDMTLFSFAPVEAPVRMAVRGTLFQFYLSGTSGVNINQVSRLVFRLRDQEDPK